MVARNVVIFVALCAFVSMSYGWLSRSSTVSNNFHRNLQRRQGIAMSDYEQRFANMARLYTSEGNSMSAIFERLRGTHVCVIGLGGVGSWVTESLARSGVGKLTLIDMDDVCISNTNRQIMAQTSTVGKFKADCLKDRIMDINPTAEVNIVLDFLRPNNAAAFLTSAHSDTPGAVLDGRYDYVIDALDSNADKAAIIDACVRSGTPVVTCGGVGGLTDPTLLTVSDLAQAEGDSLLYRMRRTLRREYGYPSFKEKEEDTAGAPHGRNNQARRVRKWGILAVHTLPTGIARTPARSQRAEATGSVSDTSQSDEGEQGKEACSVTSEDTRGGFRTCDVSLGNACFVTGAVGLLLSSCVVNAVGWGHADGPPQGTRGGKVAVRPLQLGHYFASRTADKKDASDTSQQAPSIISAAQYDDAGDCSCGKQSAPLTGEMCLESADMVTRGRQEQEQGIHTLLGACMAGAPVSALFDAHSHLQLPPVSAHSTAALALASSYKISRISVCGTAPGDDWEKVRIFYEMNPSTVLPSFGLHPWYINAHLAAAAGSSLSQGSNWEAQLETLLLQIPTAGVGECGLDRLAKTQVDSGVQEQILRAHIALAAKHQRVLTLHCVPGCWDHLLQILTEQQKRHATDRKIHKAEAGCSDQPGNAMPSASILHSCNSMPAHLVPLFARLHNTFFSLSMGGAGITDKVVALVRSITPQRLLLETDSPDQLPSHLRRRNTAGADAGPSGGAVGKDNSVTPQLHYNEPALLQYHCKKLSESLGVAYSHLAAQTYENTCRAFGVSMS